MDTNYWYNGNYELVDDGDIRQKKETKPGMINKEIQTMLSSSFVSLDNINENMIQKNSDRYNINGKDKHVFLCKNFEINYRKISFCLTKNG